MTSQLQQTAFTSDEIHYRLVDHPLEVLASGRLGMERAVYRGALDAFMAARVVGEVGRSAAEFGRYWMTPSGEPSRYDTDEVAQATAEEFGLPVGQLVNFLLATAAVARTLPGPAKVLSEADLVGRLLEELGWSAADVRTAFDLFATEPRADFHSPPALFESRDVWPWNFSRRLSYLRKPLLVRSRPGERSVVFGSRNLVLAAQTVLGITRGVRYQPRKPRLKQLVGRWRNEETKVFNDEVAALYESVPGLVVRRRFAKAKGIRISRANGDVLGDIDVLVADTAERRLIAVEAKDLTQSRTPVEFAHDLESVLEPRDKRSASVDKHLERIEWLQHHRPEVLAQLGLETSDANAWTVQPLVVLNLESFAPFLVRPRVPVVSMEQLREQFSTTGGSDR